MQEATALRAVQFAHDRFRSERSREIPADRADIRTAAATDFDAVGVFVRLPQKLHIVNDDFLGLQFKLDASARKLVATFAIHVLGAVLGRHLHYLARHRGQKLDNFPFARDMPPINQFSRAIQRVR